MNRYFDRAGRELRQEDGAGCEPNLQDRAAREDDKTGPAPDRCKKSWVVAYLDTWPPEPLCTMRGRLRECKGLMGAPSAVTVKDGSAAAGCGVGRKGEDEAGVFGVVN